MKENNINILSTRPLNKAIIALAAQKGINIHEGSFIETRSLMNERLENEIVALAAQPATILITSMNAANAVTNVLMKSNLQPVWKVFSLAGTTGKLIKNYFTKAQLNIQAINALELAPIIIASKPKQVVFFCGNIRRDALPQQMKSAGIQVSEHVVYETIKTPVRVNKSYAAILFYSPSAVSSFFSVNQIQDNVVLFAIGITTAETIRQHCNNIIIESQFPSKEQMVEQAIKYFTTVNQNK